MGITCQICGTANKEGIAFCSACGSPLAKGSKPSGEKGAAKGLPAKTVLFGMKSPVQESPSQPKSEKKSTGTDEGYKSAKTVLGLPAAGGHPGASSYPPPERPAARLSTSTAKTTGKPKSEQKKGSAKTVIGMAAVPIAKTGVKKSSKPPMAKPSTPPKPAQKKDRPGLDKRTMLGIPAMGSETAEAPVKDTGKTAPIPEVKPEKSPPKREEEVKAKTDIEKAAARASAPEKSSVSEAVVPKADDRPFDEWPEESAEPRRKTLSVVMITAAVITVVAIGALLYLIFSGGGTALIPQVYATGDGKGISVVLPFPEAPPGSTVQVGGQTIPVEQGQARVELAMSELKLGVNQVPLVYQEPGANPENMSFPIALRHSISTDLTGLSAEQPFVSINFKVADGIELAVEGQPAQLVDGAYVKRVPLSEIQPPPENEGDTWLYRVSFQLKEARGGTTEQGQHMVVIPLTKLQIDRPAEDAVVASESITVSGITENGAQLMVAGKPVGVAARAFSTTVPLPKIGEHSFEIIARAPGKAPRTRTARVTRIESLEPAIEDWSKDLDEKLTYPTLGRDANAHVGKKMKLHGRVVNISTEKGVTAFLLYIADGCPTGARCAVYGVFRGETDAGLQSWVDVYGTVKGTRTVDLPNGQQLEVPAVEAAFVQKNEKSTLKKSRKKNKRK